MSDDKLFPRLALMAEVSDRWRTKSSHLGRTAMMKICFFLQETKGISLDYNFSLYSYGPFDSDVLSDLGTAVRLNLLKESIVYYPSGIGYEYRPGVDIGSARKLMQDFLSLYSDHIQWAVDTFGNKTAGELELLSTTIYIAKYQNPEDFDHLVDQVELTKPHFSKDQIRRGVQELITLDLLRSQPSTS